MLHLRCRIPLTGSFCRSIVYNSSRTTFEKLTWFLKRDGSNVDPKTCEVNMDSTDSSRDEDFAARLRQYGLTANDLIQTQLTTVRSSVTCLYMDRPDSAVRPIILKTDDFDDLSRWIGVHDDVFEKVDPFVDVQRSKVRTAQATFRSSEAPPADAARDMARSAQVRDPALAHEVARAYLFGDSRPLKQLKPWLSTMFPSISIPVWAFLDILVKSGSVLEFGPGPNVLVARSVTIEPGGKIRSHGHLKVDVTTIEKPSRFSSAATLNAALNVIRTFK
jgi:hypothetical protein